MSRRQREEVGKRSGRRREDVQAGNSYIQAYHVSVTSSSVIQDCCKGTVTYRLTLSLSLTSSSSVTQTVVSEQAYLVSVCYIIIISDTGLL